MAWEHREGQFTLFRNDKKEPGNNQPDLRGDGMLNGELVELAVWEKEGRKGVFYSGKIKPKAERAEAAQSKFDRHEDEPEQSQGGGGSLRDALDEDIPFAPEWR